MTIKTASGSERFQEEKEFGSRFQKPFEFVSTMNYFQPEQSIEPHLSKETIEKVCKGKEESESQNDGQVYHNQWKAHQKDQERKEYLVL